MLATFKTKDDIVRQINLEKMSLKDLLELEIKVQLAIETAKDTQRIELKQRIEEIASDSGFSIEELFSHGRPSLKGRTVAPKYINPDNRSETWTGRGRKPKWLVAKLENGAAIEEFAI
ncbi:MAG: Trans-acting regulatory protein HvrA [Hyphomicrobiaceae bacterium hypho_1]